LFDEKGNWPCKTLDSLIMCVQVKLFWVSNVIACMQWSIALVHSLVADDLFIVFNIYTPSANIFNLSIN